MMVVKHTWKCSTRVDKSDPIKICVNLAVGVSKNDHPCFGILLFQVQETALKIKSMPGIMHKVEEILRKGYMPMGQGQGDPVEGRFKIAGQLEAVEPVPVALDAEDRGDL